KMNTVGNDIRAHATIREHRRQNTRAAMVQRAMVQRTHGIEGMGSVSRSRGDSALGRLEIGVGMSQAHRDPAPRGFGNDLGRALQFGSNRHHANSSARRLPEPLESRERRSQQVFRWVYPATHMADEWTLKMDPERAGAIRAIRVPVFSFVIALAFFDRTH